MPALMYRILRRFELQVGSGKKAQEERRGPGTAEASENQVTAVY